MEALLSCIAPILLHMAEDAWLNIPWKTAHQSVFQVSLRSPLTFFDRRQPGTEVAEYRPRCSSMSCALLCVCLRSPHPSLSGPYAVERHRTKTEKRNGDGGRGIRGMDALRWV